jgi:hypothetical protein
MLENIIIGIDESSDIEKLLTDGVRQFYLGYIPPAYLENYASQTSLNRRYKTKEQFTNLIELKKTIETIHKYNGIVYLALNAFTSNSQMRKYALELLSELESKVDGIIVANITMAMLLKERGYLNIVISNLFGVYNIQSVAFLQSQFSPMKIILPRDIALEDIAKIVTAYPNQQFECFLYGDNCRYSESFCFTEHGYEGLGFGSLCSYTMREKKLIHVANPSYKQVVKNSTLTLAEKKEALQVSPIDITSLLDNISIGIYEEDTHKIHKALEILYRFDSIHFTHSKLLYIKTLQVLELLKIDKAKALLVRLKEYGYQEEDSYKTFHKTNSSAIRETIAFLGKFKNIVSYKIPARGRDLYRYIEALDSNIEPYHYKESQYKL